jgi:hypothetical protein
MPAAKVLASNATIDKIAPERRTNETDGRLWLLLLLMILAFLFGSNCQRNSEMNPSFPSF